MYGPNWPRNGEIDIIEGVNSQQSNTMALHTAPGCRINDFRNITGADDAVETEKRRFSGSIETSNCDVDAPDQAKNVGCTIVSSDKSTYGDGFNDGGGGVYAMEWTADAISIFHFSRANIPNDLGSGSPDLSTWGSPLAVFDGCNFRETIANQSLVFDLSFCGVWAGQDAVWRADSMCSEEAATCQDYVARNPAAFANSFWEINYLKVYQRDQRDLAIPLPSTELRPQTNRTNILLGSQTESVETGRLLNKLSTSIAPSLAPTSRGINRPPFFTATERVPHLRDGPTLPRKAR